MSPGLWPATPGGIDCDAISSWPCHQTLIISSVLKPMIIARRDIRMAQVPALDLTYAYFNMEDPVVGGYTQEKVALRRAISLAYNTRDEIANIRKGQAIPAQTPYSPGVAGYDPDFRTSASEYSVPKARALLDMYGYVDRDGDGFREMPDGSPLVLQNASTPSARDQQIDELWKRSMDDVGLRMSFKKVKWPDLLKESQDSLMGLFTGTDCRVEAETLLPGLRWGEHRGTQGGKGFALEKRHSGFWTKVTWKF